MLSEPLSSINLWKFKFEFEYSNYNSYLIQNLIRNTVSNKDMKNACFSDQLVAERPTTGKCRQTYIYIKEKL